MELLAWKLRRPDAVTWELQSFAPPRITVMIVIKREGGEERVRRVLIEEGSVIGRGNLGDGGTKRQTEGWTDRRTREGWSERVWEGGREEGRKVGTEGVREGGKAGRRDGGRDGGQEGRTEGRTDGGTEGRRDRDGGEGRRDGGTEGRRWGRGTEGWRVWRLGGFCGWVSQLRHAMGYGGWAWPSHVCTAAAVGQGLHGSMAAGGLAAVPLHWGVHRVPLTAGPRSSTAGHRGSRHRAQYSFGKRAEPKMSSICLESE